VSLDPSWNWGPAFCSIREDLNILAWLFEEERETQRLYLETLYWSMTGARFTVEQFAHIVGAGATDKSPSDDTESAASGALDASSES
jgi:hypothetical protein